MPVRPVRLFKPLGPYINVFQFSLLYRCVVLFTRQLNASFLKSILRYVKIVDLLFITGEARHCLTFLKTAIMS